MNYIKLNIKRYTYILLSVGLAIALSSCSKSESAEPQTTNTNMGNTTGGNTTTGGLRTAPGFSLKSLDHGTISLADYPDKVVVLFFFGNNCSLCMASGVQLERDIYDMYKSNDEFVILGLDTWDGNASRVRSFQTSTGVTFPLLRDGSEAAEDYRTTYDRLVIINKQGKIQYTGTQNAKEEIDTVIPIIESLLN